MTPNSRARALVCSLMSAWISVTGSKAGSTQAESPEWMPASSMCSMMPPMTVILPVADGVHVHLDGVLQELVDEDGVLGRGRQGPIHEIDQGSVVRHDLHGPPAQHVGGPHQHGIGDFVGDGQGLLDARGRGVGGLAQVQFGQHLLEALPVLGPVDGVGGGAEDVDAGLAQGHGQVQRGLAAELEDQALGASRWRRC